jgi:formyl-CoA transferase
MTAQAADTTGDAIVGGPLSGIRILDFTQVVGSSFCSRILGDLGAEIIKVERHPTGDIARTGGTLSAGDPVAPFFLLCNAGKKSICIDIRSAEGVDLVKRLLLHVDVVLEGYVPGQMAKYGLDYATLSAIKSDIVYCSMSGFGQTGPLRNWLALAPIVEAMSGLSHASGDPDGHPRPSGLLPGDANGAINGCLAVLAALFYRERTGIGQYVDTAMFDSLVWLDAINVPHAAVRGQNTQPHGHHHTAVVPLGVFACQEGYVMLQATGSGDGSQWARFCRAAGLDDMIADPRFDNAVHRIANRVEVIRRLEAWFRKQPTAEATAELLQAKGVPAAPVMTPLDVISHPHVEARGLFRDLYHPILDRVVPTMLAPYKYSKTPVSVETGAPLLGQHNEDVLRTVLSLSDNEIAALTARGVISQDAKVARLRSEGRL